MDDIVASSRRVTEIMAEVVEVSLAQSARLGEVTEDITQRAGEPARAAPPTASVRPMAPALRARPAANGPLQPQAERQYVRY
jgi:methyl-accepting chemotaxis protein